MTTQPFSPPQQEFGTLRLQVSTALGAFPVPNATIEVLSENGGAYGRGHGNNGITRSERDLCEVRL